MNKIFRVMLIVIFLASCQAAPVVPPTPTPEPTLAPTLVPTAAPTPDTHPFVYTGKVGEFTLTLTCEGKGKPTIILENSLNYISWSSTTRYSSISQTCRYLRPGMQGEYPKTKRTIIDQVNTLHTLLQQANIGGPYILVGHAFAGYIIIPYANQYPAEVAGMVCVNCGHPIIQSIFMEKIKTQYASDPKLKEIENTAIMSYNLFEFDPIAGSSGDEYIELGANSDRITSIKSLGNLPFVVLVAENQKSGRNPQNDILYSEANKVGSERISQLSTQGRMEIVPNTTFLDISYDEAVTKAIQEVYDKVKK
jgi:hypothetical protein